MQGARLSETAFTLAVAQERVRLGREIVAQQEQRDAIRKGCGAYFESDDKFAGHLPDELGPI